LLKVAQGLYVLNWVFWLPMCVFGGGLLLAFAGFISPETVAPATLVTLTVVGPILNLWGRPFCLLHSPATREARWIVTITAVVDAATVLLSLASMVIVLPDLVRVFGLFQAIWLAFSIALESQTTVGVGLTSMQLLNATLFLYYLRWLAGYIEKPKLVRRTSIVFLLGVLGTLAAITVLVLFSQGFFNLYLGVLWIAGGVVILVEWALFGDLHYHIRRAILNKLQPKFPAPVSATAPVPETAPATKDAPTREAASTQATAPTQAAAPPAKRKEKRGKKKKRRR
jgi:hypothetical protein